MYAGFDYGTSHCAIGVCDFSPPNTSPSTPQNPTVKIVTLEGDKPLVPSTLHAPRVALNLPRSKAGQLRTDSAEFSALRFGETALGEYLADPTRGYFVKSPKSFLGVAGLSDDIRERFVTVIAAMMANVKQRTDEQMQADVAAVVIGRPVNFQGLGGKDANTQSLAMLEEAARLAGFKEIAFQYEPMAAALEYEARLTKEEKILVIDIGGGTTDCSFVRVGASRRDALDRSADVLGHSGERRGGNDYDQALALHAVMRDFGYGDFLRSGLPLPNSYFVDAVSTNDVNAQQRFYSQATRERLEFFAREAVASERAQRLLAVCEQRATYRVLRGVELAKIELSSSERAHIDFGDLEQGFGVTTTSEQLLAAFERLLEHLQSLVDEAVKSAGVAPERVYLTGGMAKSRVVREFLQASYPNVSFVDSDHFLSVTEGLTLWAQRLFR